MLALLRTISRTNLSASLTSLFGPRGRKQTIVLFPLLHAFTPSLHLFVAGCPLGPRATVAVEMLTTSGGVVTLWLTSSFICLQKPREASSAVSSVCLHSVPLRRRRRRLVGGRPGRILHHHHIQVSLKSSSSSDLFVSFIWKKKPEHFHP